jgi:hypothetical protein
VSNIMMRNVLLLVPAAAILAGCGNLSQEDLLFLGAIPAKEALEVRPAGADSDVDDAAGTTTQAMEVQCAHEFDVKCHARNIAATLNTITFSLLGLVDKVVEFPPSKRAPGRRVWGPFFDFAGGGNTTRFEMVRVDGGRAYRFCLHAVVGRIDDKDADDVTCDTDVDEDSGLTLLLDGTLTPGTIDGARARTGAGTMTLQTGRVPDLAPFGRTMEINFANTDGQTDIDITVEGQPELFGVGEREPLKYTFFRDDDGSGDFGFVLFTNINKPEENLPRIERLDMVAKWLTNEAGVGRVRVTEGDLGAEVFVADQCWDSTQSEVFLAADYTADDLPYAALDPYVLEDVAQCPFDIADVELPALE